MPTVSLLSIEPSQSTDIKGASSGSAEDSSSTEQQFSALMKQHLSEDKGGKNNEQAAESSGKQAHNSAKTENSSQQTDANSETKSADSQANKNSAEQVSADSQSEQTKAADTTNQEQAINEADAAKAKDSPIVLDKTTRAEFAESEQFLSMLNNAGKLLNSEDKANGQAATGTEQTATSKVDFVKAEGTKLDGPSAAQVELNNKTLAGDAGDKALTAAQQSSQVKPDIENSATEKSLSPEAAKQLAKEEWARLTGNKLIDQAVNGNKHTEAKSGSNSLAAALAGAEPASEVSAKQQTLTDLEARSETKLSAEALAAQKLTVTNQQLEANQNKSDTDNAATNQAAIKAVAQQTEQGESDELALKSSGVISDNKSLKASAEGVDLGKVKSATDNAKNQALANKEQQAELLSTKQTNTEVEAESAQLSAELNPLAAVIRENLTTTENQKPTQVINGTSSATSKQVMLNGEQQLPDGSSEQASSDELAQALLKQQAAEGITTEQDSLLESTFKLGQVTNGPILAGSSTIASDTAAGRPTASAEQLIEAMSNKVVSDNNTVQKAQTTATQETIAIHHKDFNNAVKEKVMLMINQKLQNVEIRLDPPELGSMHVRLNLQNEQAAVTFTVQNQQAKEALEQNLGKLRDMLAENGVDVGDANINHQQQSTHSEGEGEQQSNQFSSSESDSAEVQMATIDGNLFKASANGIDYYA